MLKWDARDGATTNMPNANRAIPMSNISLCRNSLLTSGGVDSLYSFLV